MTDPEAPLLLYVEDEVLIQVAVIDGLEEAGYRLVVAKSGAEALGLLEKHTAELRGVVTDINLGTGIDGSRKQLAGLSRSSSTNLRQPSFTRSHSSSWVTTVGRIH